MTEQLNTMAAEHAVILLKSYSFDLEGFKAEELVAEWLELYKGRWIRLAVVEALYQGRYKAISVNQLLVFWQRRGDPICHFNHEFEHIVCDSFIQTSLTAPIAPSSASASEGAASAVAAPNQTVKLEVRLPSVEETEESGTENSQTNEAQAAHPAATTTPKPRDLSLPTLSAFPLALPPASQTKSASNGSDSPFSDRPSDHSPQESLARELEQSDPLLADNENPDSIPEILNSPPDLDLLLENPFLLGSELTEEEVHPLSSIHNPIHQFVPVEDPSEFYDKLKAVALTSQSEF